MATAFSVPVMLRLARSTQSGNYTMTAAWQTVYSRSQIYAFMFASAKIDLTNMLAADHVEIRVSTRHTSGGAYIIEQLQSYDNAQPVNKAKITIGSIMDTFGVLIEMRQTIGALIVVYGEFYDTVR